MITGRVEEFQALVGVTFRLPNKPDIEIEFVVDTGFEGAITMPLDAVLALGLPFLQEMNANLANNESVRADVHVATVVWDGKPMDVPVLAIGRRPLL